MVSPRLDLLCSPVKTSEYYIISGKGMFSKSFCTSIPSIRCMTKTLHLSEYFPLFHLRVGVGVFAKENGARCALEGLFRYRQGTVFGSSLRVFCFGQDKVSMNLWGTKGRKGRRCIRGKREGAKKKKLASPERGFHRERWKRKFAHLLKSPRIL